MRVVATTGAQPPLPSSFQSVICSLLRDIFMLIQNDLSMLYVLAATSTASVVDAAVAALEAPPLPPLFRFFFAGPS